MLFSVHFDAKTWRMFSVLLCFLLYGCFQSTRDETDQSSGKNDSIPVIGKNDSLSKITKHGFRPFFVGSAWEYVSHNENIVQGVTGSDSMVELSFSVLAETTAVIADSLTVFFQVKTASKYSSAQSSDTLKEGYVGNHGKYRPGYPLATAGCDVDSWYPDTGAWITGASVRFNSHASEFNMRISLCEGSFPSDIPNFRRAIKAFSYIDSSRGLVYKYWTQDGSDRGQVALAKFNKEEIDALELKRITDSLYHKPISSEEDPNAGQFLPFMVGNSWRYNFHEMQGEISHATKFIDVDRSAMFIWGKMVFLKIKDSTWDASAKEYRDSLAEQFPKGGCAYGSWYPDANEGKRIHFDYGGRKYAIFRDSCARIHQGSRTVAGPVTNSVISYIDSTRGLIYRLSEYRAAMDVGYCGSVFCQSLIELDSLNHTPISSEGLKAAYDSLAAEGK
jgi:hypothetical protein